MKFAYLIMAHHRFDVLKLLLEDLDDVNNDIFLHIDKKTIDYSEEELKRCIKNAKLVFVKRMKIFWSDFSQIQCVINLLQEATNYGFHDYYHFLVGVEFPIKSKEYIQDFFTMNNGKEFIGYCRGPEKSLYRIQYYHFLGKYERFKNKREKLLYTLNKKLLSFQRRIGVNRLHHENDYYKKGYANWSITHDLALYIINEFYKDKRQYKFSSCADEVFFQTVVYHSPYYKNVFDVNDEYHSCMRLTTWDDRNNQLHMKDLDHIIKSDKLFARKFDTGDAVDIIEEIKKLRL